MEGEMITSTTRGHSIEYINNRWIYSDTKTTTKKERSCAMCEYGTLAEVLVKIPKDLSHSKKAHYRFMKIDSCIASIVKALQEGGIDMRGSCCGHGKGTGSIDLQDGRTLIIQTKLQRVKSKKE